MALIRLIRLIKLIRLIRLIRGKQLCRVITDMELWTEVRRRVLTGELSKRAACRESGIHWQTLAKMLRHAEQPGYRLQKSRPSKQAPFTPVIDEILATAIERCIANRGIQRSGSGNVCGMSTATTVAGRW